MLHRFLLLSTYYLLLSTYYLLLTTYYLLLSTYYLLLIVTFSFPLRLMDIMVQNEEAQYIARILNGETECFSVFLDRYGRPLYSLIVQIVGCPEDAEELVQDVFLKAFKNLSGYKGDCIFSTWLYRIAYNTAISATRKKKHEFLYIEENAINNVPDEKVATLFEPTDDEERISRLAHAVDLLSVEEKALITLFYYEEKSIEEVGGILKLTVANVKVRLYRVRKKLYLLMNEG